MLSDRAPSRNGESGFTLVELLVTVALCGMVTAALAAVVMQGLRIPGQSEDRTLYGRDIAVLVNRFSDDIANNYAPDGGLRPNVAETWKPPSSHWTTPPGALRFDSPLCVREYFGNHYYLDLRRYWTSNTSYVAYYGLITPHDDVLSKVTIYRVADGDSNDAHVPPGKRMLEGYCRLWQAIGFVTVDGRNPFASPWGVAPYPMPTTNVPTAGTPMPLNPSVRITLILAPAPGDAPQVVELHGERRTTFRG